MYEFQKELEESVIGWNEVVKKMVGGESKVRDVCAVCNNEDEVLGNLDAYGKRLLTDSGLLVENYVKTDLTLKYDFALLLRWLMKMSFNSSRTDGKHSFLFEEYVPFMRGLSAPPPRWKVATVAYLAAPEYLDQSRIKREPFLRFAAGSKVLNPFFVRICYGAVTWENSYTLRLNIFGPLVLYMLMFNDAILPGHAAAAIRSFLKRTPGSVELTSTRKLVELRAGSQTWLDLCEPQANRARALSGAG